MKQRIDRTGLEWFKADNVDGDFPWAAKIVVQPGFVAYISLGVAGDEDDQLAVLFSDEAARAHGRFFEFSALTKRK